MGDVRTRFAPSPTGYLHIGGVRTALFNYLYARGNGGQFLLRIDDTDAERNVQEALAPILHGFRWLDMHWDEGPAIGGPYEPYYQSKRLTRYQAVAQELLAKGFAYKDYATPAELDAERKAAEAAKVPYVYSRTWMAETEADAARFEAEGRKGVVRLKMPREGKLVLEDVVRGTVEFEWAREQDHVVQRADGTCLYHLANIVDDYDFKISHVIRAEEHLSNTPRQVFMIQALGYPLPIYAHVPYVAEPGSRNKLSKRKIPQYLKNKDFNQVYEHGLKIAQRIGASTALETFNPVVVDFYETVGYLPDAIINYLLLVGWSLDDKTEFISRAEMVQHFTLDRVVKASASLDMKKLWAFQDHYMRLVPLDEKVSQCLPYLVKAKIIADDKAPGVREKLAKIIEAAGDRIKVYGDVIQYAESFFVADEAIVYDQDAFTKRLLAPNAATLLAKFRDQLAGLSDFNVPTLEATLQAFIAAESIKINDIIHALRVATTGQPVGPGLYDCLAILGKAATLKRLDRALSAVAAKAV